MENIIKSNGITFGIYFGLFLISLTLYAYAVDLSFFVSFWMLGFVILGYFVNSLWVIGSLKKKQGGYITFKEGFSTYFISIAIALLISTLLSILIFNIIDPELTNIVKDLEISKTTEMLENFGAPSESIDEAINKIQDADKFSTLVQIKGYFMTLGVTSIFGLLFALILKKKKEEY